ncbi:venom nerve growth factor 2 [Elysia marginata]|uniref:Venom nerve growth factor 2 n=1 Tax=Elysia marginata TaxID=1093978 RepID=A0AAV4F3K4_9GAST|nr:venom nerve growth factor 2 [Elysia marginata]
MTVLIVQPSPASPSAATDVDPPHPQHHGSPIKHTRDTAYTPHSLAHHHEYEIFTKRGFREADSGEADLTDSGNENRRNLDTSLGLSDARGAAISLQPWTEPGLTPGGPFRIECCPSEVHLIHPRGGISRDGRLLELYRDHRTVQTFYQTTCLGQVRDRPCPLVRPELMRYSRCVQKYSFVYAFVRDFNVSESFRLDYIRLKSGCSCEVKL